MFGRTSTSLYVAALLGLSATAWAGTPPVINVATNFKVVVGSNLEVVVNATDIDSDPITLTASNLPSGATFAATNGDGVLVWTNAAPTGRYTVVFSAGDTDGVTTAETAISVIPPSSIFTRANGSPITIRDNTNALPYPSSITLTGTLGLVEKVEVTIDGLTHSYPEDIQMVLVGPHGQSVALLGSQGGGNSVTQAVTLTFSDDAESYIFIDENLNQWASGRWKPTGSITNNLPAPAPTAPYSETLSNFSGTSPAGTWSLYVSDNSATETGHISRGWSLTLTVSGEAPPAPDSDADGIEDAWELLYFGSLTNMGAQTDWDADGFLDVDEFGAGTSPTNAGSFLKCGSASPLGSGGSFVMQWPGVTGKTYAVALSTNLESGSFTPWVTNIPGIAPLTVITTTPPGVTHPFLRVQLQR